MCPFAWITSRWVAKVRAEHGRELMGPLCTAMGESIFDVEPTNSHRHLPGTPEHARSILSTVGLPESPAEALDDTSWDNEIEAETDEARERTGNDVGTPIIHYDPPDGHALFGPRISRVPSDEQAAELWDHVGRVENRHGGSRRQRHQ